ncbi:hypothetical protein [Prescottella sp. R16]|nr:hypothetical protein [Prescottella sp. R16]
MGSTELVPIFEFFVDFADATSGMFEAFGFFAGSLDTAGQLFG